MRTVGNDPTEKSEPRRLVLRAGNREDARRADSSVREPWSFVDMSVIERVKATLSSYSDGDVRSILHADHQRIRELAKELAETDSAARRRTLVRELKPFLTAHSPNMTQN